MPPVHDLKALLDTFQEHWAPRVFGCQALVMDAEGEPKTGDAGGARTALFREIQPP